MYSLFLEVELIANNFGKLLEYVIGGSSVRAGDGCGNDFVEFIIVDLLEIVAVGRTEDNFGDFAADFLCDCFGGPLFAPNHCLIVDVEEVFFNLVVVSIDDEGGHRGCCADAQRLCLGRRCCEDGQNGGDISGFYGRYRAQVRGRRADSEHFLHAVARVDWFVRRLQHWAYAGEERYDALVMVLPSVIFLGEVSTRPPSLEPAWLPAR